MKKALPLLFAAALAGAAAPALAGGGTLAGTVNAGGALGYASSTVAGSEFDLDLHGGVYVVDSVLAGGNLYVQKNDAVTAWELSATGRFHFLDPWLTDEGGAMASFSPYVGLRLGWASGDNKVDDDTGAVLAFRLGTDFFITDNFAVDLYVDAATSSGDVYADKAEMKSSNVRVHLGFDLFF
ncbi:MAG: hypothetical protein IJV65_01045 [Kiritimatiellae bacterium]|nr:hypothetical protein [Kiritimatiellia bacterium]